MTEAFDQYRIDQAEAWLSKVRKVVGYAKKLEEQAANQYARADGLKAIDYSAIRVSMPLYVDQIPDAIAAHEEAGDSISVIARSARERVEQAEAALSRMDNLHEVTCLRLYYISTIGTWEQVGDAMGYRRDGMMTLRRKALLHAYDVMPYTEREPVHPAI